jgi:hypothetical protein
MNSLSRTVTQGRSAVMRGRESAQSSRAIDAYRRLGLAGRPPTARQNMQVALLTWPARQRVKPYDDGRAGRA